MGGIPVAVVVDGSRPRRGAQALPGGRRARPRAALAVLALVVGLAPVVGCRRPAPQDSAPGTTAPAASAAPTSPTASAETTGPPAAPGTTRPAPAGGPVYVLAGSGPWLAPLWRAEAATAEGALRSLLGGGVPTDRTTAIPPGVRLVALTTEGSAASVDLAGGFDAGGGSATMLARLAQVVYTVTAFPPVDRVAFRLEGRPVTVFSGEGIELDGPIGRAWFADSGVVPPVLVERPAAGETVRAPLELAGSARQGFGWRLERNGARVAAGTVGPGAAFRHSVAYRPAAPERLELVVEAAGGGARFAERRPFTLAPAG